MLADGQRRTCGLPATLGADVNCSPDIETSHGSGSVTELGGEILDRLLVC